MQLASPIDIEDALRIDLAALLDDCRVFAPPIPADLRAHDVLIERVGGARVSGVSHEHDVSIDCYAADDADAVILANRVHGIISSLPLRDTSTQYSAATANLPYMNHDPRSPQLSRCTFRATLITPGNRITF